MNGDQDYKTGGATPTSEVQQVLKSWTEVGPRQLVTYDPFCACSDCEAMAATIVRQDGMDSAVRHNKEYAQAEVDKTLNAHEMRVWQPVIEAQCPWCGVRVRNPVPTAIVNLLNGTIKITFRITALGLFCGAARCAEPVPHDHPPEFGYISSCLGCKAARSAIWNRI